MIVINISCLILLGHLSMALPLDSPTANLTQYFDSRIVGGTLAPEGSSPHMTALVIGEYFLSFVCGASVITERHVLTAAHCITAFVDWHGNLLSTFHGVVGTLTWNRGGIKASFLTYKNHPDYNPVTLKCDVGILTLKIALSIIQGIRPIRMHKDQVDGGVSCFVTGWGTERLWGNVPEHLQILHMQTMHEDQCKQLMAEVSAGLWPPPPIDYNMEICTFHSYGHGMCHGDSGSALVHWGSGRLMGMVSWGIPCGIGAPDMFVRIQPFLPFMQEIVGKRYLL